MLAKRRCKISRNIGSNYLARYVRILKHYDMNRDAYTSTEANNMRLLDLRNAPTVDAEREDLKEHLLEITRKRATLAKQYTVSLLACCVTNVMMHDRRD